MKPLLLVICFLSLCQNSFGQEKVLRIEHRTTHKEITIKENKRVQIITKTDEKFVGRFTVLNQNSIAINEVILDINEIARIKKQPLLGTILIKANFFHMGTVVFLVSLISGYWPIILFGAAHLTGGIVSGITVSKFLKRL